MIVCSYCGAFQEDPANETHRANCSRPLTRETQSIVQLTDITQSHPNCKKSNCPECARDIARLLDYIRNHTFYELEGKANKTNHFVNFASFIESKGLPTSNKNGWASQHWFDPKLIVAYIHQHNGTEEPPQRLPSDDGEPLDPAIMTASAQLGMTYQELKKLLATRETQEQTDE